HRAYFHLGICANLLCDRLAFARLYVQLVLKDMSRAERSYSRLVTIHRCEVICPRILQKLTNLFHKILLMIVTQNFLRILATFLNSLRNISPLFFKHLIRGETSAISIVTSSLVDNSLILGSNSNAVFNNSVFEI